MNPNETPNIFQTIKHKVILPLKYFSPTFKRKDLPCFLTEEILYFIDEKKLDIKNIRKLHTALN